MNLVDVGPSILSLYDIEAPAGAVGRSFLHVTDAAGFHRLVHGPLGPGKSTIAEMLYHEFQRAG